MSTFLGNHRPYTSAEASMSVSPAIYDPYNEISFVELNKRRRGRFQRDQSERIENRHPKPVVKRIYVKQNGEDKNQKPKLYVWREWQSPGLKNLLSELTTFMNLQEATAIYDIRGRRVTHPEDVQEFGTYYVTEDEALLIPESDDEYYPPISRTDTRATHNRHTSLSAPEDVSYSRNNLYSQVSSYPPTPPPPLHYPTTTPTPGYQRSQSNVERRLKDYDNYYDAAIRGRTKKKTKKAPRRQRVDSDEYEEVKYRSRSVHDDVSRRMEMPSEFDDDSWMAKDREALAKHKEKLAMRTRSNSAVIYNRKDQTHPEAYLIYVFLNGQGMESQYINFQRSQLEKGMPYVLELIARRFRVNPLKLCDLDGRKIVEISDLMSRGAYVLVPAGQTFRDTWYFLPDNAIDTSSNVDKIEERSNQRDRLLQKREKKLRSKTPARTTSTLPVLPRLSDYRPKVERTEFRRY